MTSTPSESVSRMERPDKLERRSSPSLWGRSLTKTARCPWTSMRRLCQSSTTAWRRRRKPSNAQRSKERSLWRNATGASLVLITQRSTVAVDHCTGMLMGQTWADCVLCLCPGLAVSYYIYICLPLCFVFLLFCFCFMLFCFFCIPMLLFLHWSSKVLHQTGITNLKFC